MQSASVLITESYKMACSHSFVDVEPPELATNEDWRGIMRRARKAYIVDGSEMTQAQLAERVGRRIRERWPKSSIETPSQVIISKIESGVTRSSKLVLAICDVLSIPNPEHLANEDDRDWIRLGRVLRSGDLDEYKHLVSMLEKLAERARAADDKPIEPANDQQPTKPK